MVREKLGGVIWFGDPLGRPFPEGLVALGPEEVMPFGSMMKEHPGFIPKKSPKKVGISTTREKYPLKDKGATPPLEKKPKNVWEKWQADGERLFSWVPGGKGVGLGGENGLPEMRMGR